MPRTEVCPDAKPNRAGDEQAARTLQPTGNSRHATTLDAEVGGAIAASPLVKGRPYLFRTAEANASTSGDLISRRRE
jgi:hypothetical protein